MSMELTVCAERLAVCRLSPDTPLDARWLEGSLAAAVRTPEELSLVLEEARRPREARAETGWRALRVTGPLDFELVGVLSGLTGILAAEGVSVFAISTFETDYLLVREERLEAAVDALRAAGHRIG